MWLLNQPELRQTTNYIIKVGVKLSRLQIKITTIWGFSLSFL